MTDDIDQPTSRAGLCIAIPAYNEADGIASFLADIDQNAGLWPGEVVVLVVDDGSTDGTAEQVCRAVRHCRRTRVHLRQHPINLGHGPTLVEALNDAQNLDVEHVLTVDGDGQFEARDLYRVARETLVPGVDVAIGVRKFRLDPWFRKVVTRALHLLARVRFGSRLADINSPLRAYRRDALATVLSTLPPTTLVPNVRVSIEILRQDLSITELYVTHRVRRGNGAQGSTWGTRSRTVIIPRKLIEFCWAALLEVWSL